MTVSAEEQHADVVAWRSARVTVVHCDVGNMQITEERL